VSKSSDERDALRQIGKYSGLAFLLPVSILVGYTIGYFLDKAFGTTYLKVVFLFLGIIAGMIELIRELTKDDAGK
jgi:F0F1-type ATP synthase assembly protein I